MSRNLLPNRLTGDGKIMAQELFTKKRREVSETQVFSGSYFGLLPPARTFKARHHSMQHTTGQFRKKSENIKENMLSKDGLTFRSRRFLLPQWKQDPQRTLPSKASLANFGISKVNPDQAESALLKQKK